MSTLVLVLVLAQIAPGTPVPAPASFRPAPTAAAGAAGPATPAPRLSGGFGRKPSPTDKAGVIGYDGSVPSSRRRGTFSVSGARAQGRSEAPAASSAVPASTDEETAWRSRVASLRADIAKAQKEYDAADAATTVVSFGRPGHDYEMLLAIRNASLAPYRIRLEELRAELAALPEECRRSPGCQPGWLR